MFIASQPSVMSVDGAIGVTLAGLVLGGFAWLISKAKDAEIDWREKRKKKLGAGNKGQKTKEKQTLSTP